jgi:hypothetical protein
MPGISVRRIEVQGTGMGGLEGEGDGQPGAQGREGYNGPAAKTPRIALVILYRVPSTPRNGSTGQAMVRATVQSNGSRLARRGL